jgi:hypothetical protein
MPTSRQARPKSHGIPCAMVLRLLRALLGVPGFLAPVTCEHGPQACPQRRGDRTTRLDRPLVPRTPCEETSGHRSLSRVRGDHDPPLLMDRMRGNLPLCCPTLKAIYFFRKGWTGKNSLRWQKKLDFRRTRLWRHAALLSLPRGWREPTLSRPVDSREPQGGANERTR